MGSAAGIAAAGAEDDSVWVTRQRLSFRGDLGSTAGAPLCLPLYLSEGDASEVLLVGPGGKALACYRDPLHDITGQHLYWVVLPPGHEVMHLYCKQEALVGADGQLHPTGTSGTPHGLLQQACPPEQVLPLADHFRGDLASVFTRWEVRSELEDPIKRISVAAFAGSGRSGDAKANPEGDGGEEPAEAEPLLPPPACGADGGTLRLSTAVGCISVARRTPVPLKALGGCIQLRAHFYDHCGDFTCTAHWMGLRSALGTASVGIAFGLDYCYSILADEVPAGVTGEMNGWLTTTVHRTPGWHVFELLFCGGSVHCSVDDEPVGTLQLKPSGAHTEEEVVLTSRCGGVGSWAGVELLHTPADRLPWEVGIQNLRPGDRIPWEVVQEEGRWQADDQGVMQSVEFAVNSWAKVTNSELKLIDAFAACPPGYVFQPKFRQLLGFTYQVVHIKEDGMIGIKSPDGSEPGVWYLPPRASALVVIDPNDPMPLPPTPSVAAAIPNAVVGPGGVASSLAQAVAAPAGDDDDDRPPSAPKPFLVGGLALECWSIAGEEDLVRMERVMTTFVEALQVAGAALPSNIGHLEDCAAPQHQSCFVYSFGTRRVHVATRLTEGGRLLLVVRCGGGFIDFVEFARRHGRVEQLRMQGQDRRTGGGREVVRLTSVLQKGKVRGMSSPEKRSMKMTF